MNYGRGKQDSWQEYLVLHTRKLDVYNEEEQEPGSDFKGNEEIKFSIFLFLGLLIFNSFLLEYQFSSVDQSCPTLQPHELQLL